MEYSPSKQMIAAGNMFVDSFCYGLGLLSRNQWGIAHRRWLLDSGRYIRTSERRWKIVGEAGPELINLQSRPACNLHWPGCGCQMEPMKPTAELDALTCHCGRIACRHHQEGR